MAQWPSLGLWMVNDRFSIADGLVLPVGDVPKSLFYPPYERPELPGRLAALKEGDEQAVLKFYQEWGLLGYANLARRILRGAPIEEREQRLREYVEAEGVLGEPLSWVWSHSRTVRMLLELIHVWEKGDQGSIERYLHGVTKDGVIEYAGPLFSHSTGFGPKSVDYTPAWHAATVITTILNANIDPFISQRYEIFDLEKGSIVRSYSIPALICVVYAHLGEAARVDGHGNYQCAYRHCEQWSPTSKVGRGPKRRFCPPVGEETESLCSRRERYYRSLDSS